MCALVACAACDTAEIVSPAGGAEPSLSVVGASGSVLASTNQGELVEIDLAIGLVSLVGDAGVFAGKDLGWTALAFDAPGDLVTASRSLSESGGDVCAGYYEGACAHLYRVDPGSGAVSAEVGSLGERFMSDLALASGTLYGTSYTNATRFCCGGLVSIDPSTAHVVWIGGPSGFGENPLSGNPLQNGGLAFHPVTGEMWGVENNFSFEPTLFRIDPVTGTAYGLVRLGMNGSPTPFGLDDLEILPDGRFIATRGGAGGVPAAQRLVEIDPVPDAVSGLAEITVIPLTYDTPLAGHINGLTIVPSSSAPLNLQLTCPATVERAQLVTCTASDVNGPVTDVDFTWTFDADPVPFTPNSMDTFAPPQVTEGPTTGLSVWAGQLVHPGTVTVTGVRGTETSTTTASIVVTDRTVAPFQVTLDPAAINAAQTALKIPQPADTSLNTGRNHSAMFPLQPDNAARFFEGSAQVGTVSDGPNKGYLFVESSDFRARRGYSLNLWIEQSPGYPYPAGGPGATTWTYVNNQPGANPAVVRNATIAHEGALGGTPPSHQQRFVDAAGDFESCGDIQKTFERLTASTLFDLTQMMNDMQNNSFKALTWASDHTFVHGHQPPNSVVADWKNPPGLLPVMSLPPVGTNPPPSATRCDTSNL